MYPDETWCCVNLGSSDPESTRSLTEEQANEENFMDRMKLPAAEPLESQGLLRFGLLR